MAFSTACVTSSLSGLVVGSKRAMGLPSLPMRNLPKFQRTSPGNAPSFPVSVQGPDGDEINFNGQRGIFNNISLDGGDYNNGFFGGRRRLDFGNHRRFPYRLADQ